MVSYIINRNRIIYRKINDLSEYFTDEFKEWMVSKYGGNWHHKILFSEIADPQKIHILLPNGFDHELEFKLRFG